MDIFHFNKLKSQSNQRAFLILVPLLCIMTGYFVINSSLLHHSSESEEAIQLDPEGNIVSSNATPTDILSPTDSVTLTPAAALTSAVTSTPVAETYVDNDNLHFSDLKGIEFWFGSGAGAWCTTLSIESDGSFTGYYHDTDMGSSGYMYPEGTRYECHFHGKFSLLTKTGDYEYSLQCISLEAQETIGQETFENNLKKVGSTPYGFDQAGEFKLYLPGKNTSELPEEYRSWSNGFADDEVLTCYGLYNVDGEKGFIVWPEQEDYVDSDEPETTPMITMSSSVIANRQKQYTDYENLTFSDLKNLDFWSSRLESGFAVNVLIQPDGTFSGTFSESSMTSACDDYPNGTVYECHFHGQFSTLTKRGPYEYTLKCDSLVTQGTVGEERIEDGTRIVTTAPQGFENADEFLLYLPGTRTQDLPEGFLHWYPGFRDVCITETYILYNVGGKDGFVVPLG